MANQKLSVDLPKYSGHPKGTTYQGPTGTTTETYSAKEWVERVDAMGEAAGWNEKVKASSGALALVPNTPAENWYRVQIAHGERKTELAKWNSFAAAIRDFFSPTVTYAARALMLQKMKQQQPERTKNYLNRIRLQYQDFAAGLDDIWETEEPFKDAKDAARNTMYLAVERTLEYVFQCVSMAGMTEAILREVSREDPQTLDEVELIATRFEDSERQVADSKRQSPQAVGAVNPAEGFSRSQVEDMIRRAVADVSRGTVAAATAAGPAQAPSRKQKDRDLNKVWCHHCGAKGHYSNACQTRINERAQGRYRATVHCPFVSQEQWGRMSREEKQRGKYMLPHSPAPPAGLHIKCKFGQAAPALNFETISGTAASFAQRVAGNSYQGPPPTQQAPARPAAAPATESSFVDFYAAKN